MPSGPAPQASGSAVTLLDRVMVVLVAVLAFLLASFPAQNSDLWMHLAAGQHLTHGEVAAITDPDLPVSHTWLYDLLSFGLYQALRGPGLVVLKALLVTGLALLLLRLSRIGPGWWLPAFCTALALLAMSTRLLLQPATVSCLFLALALWLTSDILDSGSPIADLSSDWQSPIGNRNFLLLLLLFAVWTNSDSWFVLGLGTVALVYLGRVLDSARRGRRGTSSLLVCPALLAAVCLLNPTFFLHPGSYLLHLVPPELRLWSGPYGTAVVPFAVRQLRSPFTEAYFAKLGQSPAGLAYFPLLGLGLLSFLLNLPRWPWQRFLPWLGLALVSAVQVRAVPFFAVVAGPVLAWNLHEALARRLDAQREAVPLRLLIAGRVLAVLLALVFVACAWPGWLQLPPFEPRRWAVEVPPSLERGAAAVHCWHQQGKLGPDSLALHVSADTVHAFAWFCPEEKGVLLDRLASADGDELETAEDLDERLRAAGITHVILYDPDRDRLSAALNGLLSDPQRWPLLYLEGDLAVFGWRDPLSAGQEAEDPYRDWQLNPNRLAFHPAADRKAPPRPAARGPEERHWWDAFAKPAPPRPIDHDEAWLHLSHAEALRQSAPGRQLRVWQASQASALVGGAGVGEGPGALLNTRARLAFVRPPRPAEDAAPRTLPIPEKGALVLQQAFAWQQDDTSPALLYLAIRAARRAVAVNPNDAGAWSILGESYLRLLDSTRERVWAEHMPELVQLRRAQASTALNRAVALKPNFAKAHHNLGTLYREMGYLDLALDHLQTEFNLTGEAGPPPGVSAEEFRDLQAGVKADLDRLAKEVEDRENRFETAAARARVLDRALLAAQNGLAGKARDLLLESDIAAFGAPGMKLELQLLLMTGRAKDVPEWIGPEQEARLGPPTYHMLRTQALAASGEYTLAREECTQLARSVAYADKGREPTRFREVMALLIGRELLEEHATGRSLPYLLWRRTQRRAEFHDRITELARDLRREADVSVLQGLLALEEGDVDEAEVAFRVALSLWQDPAAAASGGALDFNGRPVAQGYLERMTNDEAPMSKE
jgi:Flp pilus assembly protein TadD